MSVYVIASDGRPLMPCSEAKARHLLDAKRAKVKHRTPFTIQMVVPICHGPADFNDAREFIIKRINRVYAVKPVRHHNRQLHKATILKGWHS